jgi:hypothetical protein
MTREELVEKAYQAIRNTAEVPAYSCAVSNIEEVAEAVLDAILPVVATVDELEVPDGAGMEVPQRTVDDEPERRAWRTALQMACDGDEWAVTKHSARSLIMVDSAGRARLSPRAVNGGAS